MYSNMIGEIRMTVQNMRKAKDMIRGTVSVERATSRVSSRKPSAARVPSSHAGGRSAARSSRMMPIRICCGHLEDNVPNCICRQIEATIKKLKRALRSTRNRYTAMMKALRFVVHRQALRERVSDGITVVFPGFLSFILRRLVAFVTFRRPQLPSSSTWAVQPNRT